MLKNPSSRIEKTLFLPLAEQRLVQSFLSTYTGVQKVHYSAVCT